MYIYIYIKKTLCYTGNCQKVQKEKTNPVHFILRKVAMATNVKIHRTHRTFNVLAIEIAPLTLETYDALKVKQITRTEIA